MTTSIIFNLIKELLLLKARGADFMDFVEGGKCDNCEMLHVFYTIH